MKTLHGIFSFILGLVLSAASLSGAAQPRGTAWSSSQKAAAGWVGIQKAADAKAADFSRLFESHVLARRPNMTAERVLAELEALGTVDGCLLASVLNDAAYINTLDADQAADLAYAAAYADVTRGSCDKHLLEAVLPKLNSDYDEKSEDFALKSFYALAAGALGRNRFLWHDVQDWAFKQAAMAAGRTDSARRGWGAAVLLDLAQPAVEEDGQLFVMNAGQRREFEARLKQVIRSFDWIKNVQTDYMLPGVKSGKAWSASNQGALIVLFAQANNFFSYKDNMVDPNSSVGKRLVQTGHMFITTGGFNELGRAAINAASDDANAARFSDTAEVFYFHTPTPGTDGRGHFADSANGRRHRVLLWLTQALFLSYYTYEPNESSALMRQFVRSYLETGADGRFVHYLYVPLQAMRMGKDLHDRSFFEGWDREEESLQTELYEKLKAGYPWSRACTSVQGACEMAGEWMAAGKVFGWVFKGLGRVMTPTVRKVGTAAAVGVLATSDTPENAREESWAR